MDVLRFVLFLVVAMAFTKIAESVFFNWKKDAEVDVVEDEPAPEEDVYDQPEVYDDLTIIEGIQPNMIDILADAGYINFADIELANIADLKRTIETTFPTVSESELRLWSKQASYAVQGRMDELEQLKAKIARARMRRMVQ